jgi:shikimate 5-dehydrogenase
MRLFPLWAGALGWDIAVTGLDLPLEASRECYRDALQRLRMSDVVGAVVTTHKVGLYEAARDLFDDLDPYAQLLGEVNCVSCAGGRLAGYARDALSVARTLDTMLGCSYWQHRQADVLCFGAGGAGISIALSLLCVPSAQTYQIEKRSAPPLRLALVDMNPARLEVARAVIEPLRGNTAVTYHCHANPTDNDRLLAELRAGSLIVNATGMGKDRPGSPITNTAEWPAESVAWDINYRGSRPFLTQANEQSATRRITVHDGWLYFLHGWSEALSAILGQDLSGSTFLQLAAIAETLRVKSYGEEVQTE